MNQFTIQIKIIQCNKNFCNTNKKLNNTNEIYTKHMKTYRKNLLKKMQIQTRDTVRNFTNDTPL